MLQVALGDSGLVVKGVFQRGAVGYLSHLEALRYCEVRSVESVSGGYLVSKTYLGSYIECVLFLHALHLTFHLLQYVLHTYTTYTLYMQVGSYLKVPTVPVWVVGSSSHFSVLFSLQR